MENKIKDIFKNNTSLLEEPEVKELIKLMEEYGSQCRKEGFEKGVNFLKEVPIKGITTKEDFINSWLGWLKVRIKPFYEIWQKCALDAVYEEGKIRGFEAFRLKAEEGVKKHSNTYGEMGNELIENIIETINDINQ